METVWGHQLECLGWSKHTKDIFISSLAKSTRKGYNNLLQKCKQFCEKHNVQYPPVSSEILAEFLHTLSEESKRPSSVLHSAIAALSHVYTALELQDITKHDYIKRLVTGLIKTKTLYPMKKSSVMPIQNFTELFTAWGDNKFLSTKQLRLKTITLLALAFMLRPSDVAPKGTMYDSQTSCEQTLTFTTDKIQLCFDGVRIQFFGIKNDTSRSGFEVFVPSHKNVILDPKTTLQHYLERTDSVRTDGAVFLSLQRPYRALSASSIAKILDDAIGLAGLSGQGFSAKSFRPTGATCAIHQGVDPNIVQKIGRWKCQDVFFQHYVHSKTPVDFVSNLLVE